MAVIVGAKALFLEYGELYDFTKAICDLNLFFFLLQLEGKSSPLCIVADDSVFLTILIACLTSSTSSHVISMFPGLREKGHMYLQAVADANGFSMDRVEVIGRKTCLTLDDTNQRKVISK